MEKNKPLYSENIDLQKIKLVDKRNALSNTDISSEVEKIISGDRRIAEWFNDTFCDIFPSLRISPKENYETDVANDNEPILNYINKI